MKALYLDTVSELFSRKVFLLFAIITGLLLLIVWATWEIRADMSSQSGISAGEDISRVLEPWVARAFSNIMSIFIFLAVLASAGLLPRALERGRVEFLLSKPISRTRLLIGKLISIWLAYGAVMFGSALIVYGVTAAVHGVFDIRIFLMFGVYAINFLVWVSVIGLAGVISGSASWAVMAAFVLWLAQWLLSFRELIKQLTSGQYLKYILDALYYVSPKTDQLGDLAVSLAVGRPVESWLPFWSALIFAGVMLYLSSWVFRRRDY
jgi:ABC-type transport system involved in multi-copper enzyme maturation permease subunit